MNSWKSCIHHKNKESILTKMKDFKQGAVGWGLSVDFRKNDIRLIFHILDALRTKKPSAKVVFLFVTRVGRI